MLIRNRLPGVVNKVLVSAASLIMPDGLVLPKNHNILCVLNGAAGKRLIAAHNIITNAGDVYYAQRAMTESPTNTFANLYLSTNAWTATHPQKASDAGDLDGTAIAGSSKAVASTYPKTDDQDTDNTGAGTKVMTWLFSYAKADFNATGIIAGAVAASGVTFGSGSSPILTGFTLSTFDKTANDTLKVFVNHALAGV